MTPQTARNVRRGLLTLVLAVGVSVAWTLRRSRPAASPSPSPPSVPSLGGASGTPLPGTRQENLVYRSMEGDREKLVLKARTFVGEKEDLLRAEGVELTVSYTAKGQLGRTTITADRCLYEPGPQRAQFEGHVVVRTEDGFELTSESLLYRGDKGIAKSDGKAAFKRKDLSGTSTGLEYRAEEGRLDLLADVVLRVQDPDKPPADIRAARAEVLRNEGRLLLTGGVEVKQRNDVLTAQHLEVNFGEDESIHRVQAIDQVEVKTRGGVPGASVVPGGSGPRVLRGRKLDIFLRPGGVLQEVVAGPDAELTLFAAPPDAPEKRLLRARILTFRFDAQGRLEEVHGQKDSSFSGEPLPPSRAAPRSLVSQSFLARLDPKSGEAQSIEFNRDMVFVEGKRRATAQKGWYDGPKGLLILKEGPEVVDDERGWRLAAQAIDIGTRSGDVVARHGVRNTLRSTGGASQPGLLRGPDTVATCRFFEYLAASRTARYREEALLRSGRDEIQASEIRVVEREDGRRRLEAEGNVRSILTPREEKRDEKAGGPVEARARALVYEEVKAQAVYRGDVVIRRGEILIKSTEATLDLTGEQGALRELRAGEPVEVRQGARTATGASARYDIAEGTVVLQGDKVVLKDPSQEVQGRSLTFRIGDDSIRVDGQELGRTQAVFKKEPPKP